MTGWNGVGLCTGKDSRRAGSGQKWNVVLRLHQVIVISTMLWAVAVVFTVAVGAVNGSRVVPEPLPHAEHGWVKGSRAQPEARVNIGFALRHAVDDSVLEAELEAVSTPGSPRYGHYLSRDEVKALAAPRPGCFARVESWVSALKDKDTTIEAAGHGDWINVNNVRVMGVEVLLEATFMEWKHPLRSDQVPLLRSPAYSLPEHISDCVKLVSGMKLLPTVRKRHVKMTSIKAGDNHASSPDEIVPHVSPQTLRAVWGIPSTLAGNSTNGQVQSAAEFNVGDNIDPEDVLKYQKRYKLPSQPVARIIGPNDPTKASIEASMDMQMLMGINRGTPTWVMNNGGDGFLQWLVAVEKLTPQPLVHSLSYGEDADTVDLPYMEQCNAEFIKLGLAGVTILAATGDYGVNCHQDPVLQIPTFPAGSPWVTAVGGAICGVDRKGECTTTVQSDNITGSGFSNQFGMPTWGKAAMSAYVANHTPPPVHTSFNVSGRAYPDIVSLSEHIEFYQKGFIGFTGGTSCAAPAVSGIVSLVNDARIAANKPPLGFMNPLIYSLGTAHPEAYVDITTGTRNSQGNCEGFAPAPGWDAISGWGGINFTTFTPLAVAAANTTIPAL